MAIEIVDFPIENGGSFHSYVKLPEGIVLENLLIISLYYRGYHDFTSMTSR